eukprot:jgi/Mesvir1/23412/Mv25955-RA.1
MLHLFCLQSCSYLCFARACQASGSTPAFGSATAAFSCVFKDCDAEVWAATGRCHRRQLNAVLTRFVGVSLSCHF